MGLGGANQVDHEHLSHLLRADGLEPAVAIETRLRESEQRYRELVEHATEGLIIAQDNQVRFANMAFAEMLGRSPEEVINLDRSEIVPAEELPMLEASFARRMAGNDPPDRFETRFLHKDGRVVHAEYTGRVITNQGRPAVMMIVRDITARKQAEELVRVQRDMAVALSRCTDLVEALQVLVDATAVIPGLDAGGAYVADPSSGQIRLVCHRGISEEFRKQVACFSADSLEPRVSTNGAPHVASREDMTSFAEREMCEREGIRSRAAYPILHQGRMVGSLIVASRELDTIPPEVLAMVESIAARAAGAIARLRAEDWLRVQRDMAVSLSRCTDLVEALQIVLNTTALIPGLDAAGVYMWDHVTSGVRLVCHRGLSPEFRERVSFYPANSPEASATMDHQPRYGRASEQGPSFRTAALLEGLLGTAVVPLFHQGCLVASLAVGSRTCEEIPIEARDALEIIGATAAGAISRLRAENLLRVERDLAVTLSRTSDLREALRLVLNAMGHFEEFGGRGAYIVNPVSGDLCLAYHQGVGEEFLANVTVFPADSDFVRRLRANTSMYGSLAESIPALSEVTKREGIIAAALIPVSDHGQLVGALTLASHTRNDVPVDIRTALEAIAAQASGAIARLRAEEIVRASEEKLRAIADYTFNWENWFAPNGRLLWVAPAVKEVVGYSVEECLSMPDYPLPLVHEDDRAWVCEQRKRIGMGSAGRDRPIRITRKDGSVLWATVSWHAIFDENGRLLGHRSCVLDVTARREAELLAQQRQAELMHASRLSTVGEMASGLAHELNQPLGAVCSYADACRRMLQESRLDETVDAVDKIGVQARRAAEIIRRIQGFVRKQTVHETCVDVNELIRESLAMSESEMSATGVQVDLSLADGLPQLLVDPIQIQQVVLNLVRNGLDAIRQAEANGGRLAVSTQGGVDGHILITVHDTGIGLREEDRARLFEPFFTTKANGMGLGLPISRSIVESHGGRLWAEPRQPCGTSFFVSLPTGRRGSHV